MLAELFFGNVGCSDNSYVRGDNSDAAYQMDSMNTVTREVMLNGFLEGNRGGGGINESIVRVGFIPGELNTPDGMTKSMTCVNLGSLLTGGYFSICD